MIRLALTVVAAAAGFYVGHVTGRRAMARRMTSVSGTLSGNATYWSSPTSSWGTPWWGNS